MMEIFENIFREWVAHCPECGFEWMASRENISVTGDIRGEAEICPMCNEVGQIIGTND